MPRKERLKSKTGIYHIMARGISQQRIFEQAEDYEQFLDYLFATKKISGFTLYAYTLMDNHIHLLLKEGTESISQVFKRLGTRYAQWFNGKYERSGHLFQNRFCSEPIEDDDYFLTVLVYIYQNPVKAGICGIAADYEWGSRRLLGKGAGIVDETELTGIAAIKTITQRECGLIEDVVLDEPRIGRRAAYADKTVAEMMRAICGVQDGIVFQRMPREGQKGVALKLREARVPIRQIARVTGVSKGVVEGWCKLE
jgi:REP element-mobilizing transposase RayT